MNATPHDDDHEPVEAEVVPDQPGQDLVRREAPQLTVRPSVGAGELKARLDVIQDCMRDAMIEGVDYGRVPGVDKPTLLKPGAEKLGVLFELDLQPTFEETHEPDGHLTVKCSVTVFHVPTGARVGKGRGVCTTHERKYAWRKAQRECPNCGQPAVIKGKQEYGGGWLCFEKKGGCKAKWTDDSDQGRAFAAMNMGDVPNPDLPDLWNTVVKMAEKRARVDAVLAVTGASALFTQDVEDAATAAAERQADGPKFGPPVSDEQLANTRAAIGYLFDPEDPVDASSNTIGVVLNAIQEAAGGYLPHFAMSTVVRVASAVKQRRTAGPASEPGDGDPVAETEEEREERERGERLAEAHNNPDQNALDGMGGQA